MNKCITYDHGDYRAELDGRLIGYYPNHHAAEVVLDELVYDMLTHGDIQTVQALDGAQPTDAELVEAAEAVDPMARMCAIWGIDPTSPQPGGEGTITERMARIWS